MSGAGRAVDDRGFALGIRGMTERHTGRVRAFVDDDLPQVVALHASIFGGGAEPRALASYLEAIFCRHPWRDEALPSLVYEDADGRIVGCLGVMPRPMSLNGRSIRAAVTHSFMVAPGRRSGPAALELVKAHFSGSQDISIADANQLSRPIWEMVGGTTPPLYRLRWTRPLRPGHYALGFLGRRGLSAPLASASKLLVTMLDRLAVTLEPSPFHLTAPDVSGEEVGDTVLAACLAEIPRARALRPEYNARSVKWLLTLLAQKRHLGTLRQVLVRDRTGRALGWYLYFLNPGGTSEAVQIGARDDSSVAVLGHLLHDAWQHGSVTLSGQVDPGLLPALSDTFCLLRFDPNLGVRLHSRHPELLQAVLRGDAFLTRLEGEWWFPFRGS